MEEGTSVIPYDFTWFVAFSYLSSARIDGCTEIRLFMLIGIPISISAGAAFTLFYALYTGILTFTRFFFSMI